MVKNVRRERIGFNIYPANTGCVFAELYTRTLRIQKSAKVGVWGRSISGHQKAFFSSISRVPLKSVIDFNAEPLRIRNLYDESDSFQRNGKILMETLEMNGRSIWHRAHIEQMATENFVIQFTWERSLKLAIASKYQTVIWLATIDKSKI